MAVTSGAADGGPRAAEPSSVRAVAATAPHPDPAGPGPADLPGGVVAHDGGGRLVTATVGALDLLGLTREQLAGETARPVGWRLLPGHRRDAAGDLDVPPPAVWRTGEPVVGLLAGVDDGDGSPVRWIRLDCAAQPDPAGGVALVVTTLHDATHARLVRDAGHATRRLLARAARTPVERIDELTDHVLATVGLVSGAARTTRVALDRAAGQLVLTHDWAVDGTPWPLPDRTAPIDITTRLLPYLTRDEPVIIRDAQQVVDVPSVVASMDEWGVRSGVIAPITVGDRLEGFVGLSWGEPHDPDREVVALSVVAADLMAGAVRLQALHDEHGGLHDRLAEHQREVLDERALADLRAELFPDVATELLITIDAEDRFVTCRGGLLYESEFVSHLHGRRVLDLFEEPEQARLADVLRQARAGDRTEVFEFEWPGQVVVRHFEGRFRSAGDGQVVALVREVTAWRTGDRITLEESALLALANERLTRLVQERDEFLAGVSHELRTPLNAILGLTEMLLDDGDEPVSGRQAGTLRTIESSGHHLLELINDLLDLSRLRAQVDVLDLDDVAVADPCRLAFELMRPRAEHKGLHVELADATDQLRIRADERRLRQVLLNLLDNAVKFTDPGGSVGLTVARPDADHVSLTVWDTGVGIAAADQARIFEPFTQLDGRRSGSGLGLALVERLVTLHRGRLKVDAAPGRGSRFTVVLPVAGPGDA
jgi:signal transduction histidine kinase